MLPPHEQLPYLDANRVFGSLYQGSYPEPGPKVGKAGVHVLVLAAMELQTGHYPGVQVIGAPLDDAVPMPWELVQVWSTARLLSQRLRQGQRVLVTCHMGRNRSGLIAAATMMLHRGCTADEAINRVRRARQRALTNPHFVQHLKDAFAAAGAQHLVGPRIRRIGQRPPADMR